MFYGAYKIYCHEKPHNRLLNLLQNPHDALQFSITILFFVQYLGTNLGHLGLASSQGSKEVRVLLFETILIIWNI